MKIPQPVSRVGSQVKGLRPFASIVLILVIACVTGCATYYTKKFSGISRSYESWKNVKLGTKKIFKGTIRYGGKDFPVEIQQQLNAAPSAELAIPVVSYFVAGRPAGTENAYISAKDYGPSGLGTELVMLKAEVPPAGSSRKTIYAMRPVPGILETFVFEPRQKTFQINGKSVVADRYTLTTNNNGFVEQIFAWFSSEVPGGWVAVEQPSSIIEDTSAQVGRQMFSDGRHTAKSMFQLGERFSLRLVSIEEP